MNCLHLTFLVACAVSASFASHHNDWSDFSYSRKLHHNPADGVAGNESERPWAPGLTGPSRFDARSLGSPKETGPMARQLAVLNGGEVPKEQLGEIVKSTLENEFSSLLSLIYNDTFRISIYKKKTGGDATDDLYYYMPALIVDPSSATCVYSDFNTRHEMTFSTLMWEKSFEDFILESLSNRTGRTVSPNGLRIMPFQMIRLTTIGSNDEYEAYDRWIPYASQPAVFKFRLLCTGAEKCDAVKKSFQSNIEDFVNNLIIQYSLRVPPSTKRSVVVTDDHVKASKLFGILQQKFPGKDTLYLAESDVKQLTIEIAARATIDEAKAGELISNDQALKITNLLEGLLRSSPQSTSAFDAGTWDFVYWKEDATRPDKIARSLNQIISKTNLSFFQNLIRSLYGQNFVQKQKHSNLMRIPSAGRQVNLLSSNGSDIANSTQVTTLAATSEATVVTTQRTTTPTTPAPPSEEDMNKFKILLAEAKTLVSWNGNAFVPVTLNLIRVNLAAFRAQGNVLNAQITVVGTASDITTRMNLMKSASSLNEMLNVLHQAKLLRDSVLTEMKRNEAVMKSTMTQIKTDLSTQMATVKQEGSVISTSLQGVKSSLEQTKNGIDAGLEPIGTIRMIFSDKAPSGWLTCDGTQLDCNQYRRLCVAIGGNKPKLPDFGGRFPIGFGASMNIGTTGGEEKHVLTEDEMPKHNHEFTYANASLKITTTQLNGGAFYAWADKKVAWDKDSATSQPAGSSQPHNNLPPFLTVNFIIKY